NVSTGFGGGFVYAQNVHGVRSESGHQNTTLTALNDDAVTKWDFYYDATVDSEHQKEWETSGNFVHSTQTIIDDCYNISNRYVGEGKMPAHYWYIKGSTYVYDQYISAYTGIPNAYSETVDIPLTIAAASHGRMKLLNVQPNLYAYYSSPGVKLESGKRIVINDKSYYANDPISYWDWFLLSKAEQALFVPETYTNCMTYQLDGVKHEAGTVFMTPVEYEAFMDEDHEYLDADGEPILDGDKQAADDDYIFRLSNNVSHDTGYLLTYEVNNPSIWDNWYTLKSGDYTAKKTLAEYEEMDAATKATYYDGPTYRLNPAKVTDDGILLGQRNYKEGQLITESVETTYQAAKTTHSSAIPDGQATFVPAYLVTSKITVTDPSTGKDTHYNEGVAVSEAFALANASSTEAAYICTSSIQVTKEDVIYRDSKLTATERNTYISGVNSKITALGIANPDNITDAEIEALSADDKKKLTQLQTLKSDLTNNLVPAYYCTEAGLYGGNFYEAGKNYRGLEAWSSLSEGDHAKFIYNYDALDLLVDPDYGNKEGEKYQYDGDYTSEEQVRDADTGNKAGYSVTQSVDYTASYNDAEHTLTVASMTVNRGGTPTTTTELQNGDELTREQFEALPNEQRHFAPVAVKGAGTYYVVSTAFQVGSTPYAVGEVISSESYLSLPSTEQGYVTALTTSKAEHENVTLYYCRETYDGTVTAISSTDITGAGAGVVDGKVQKGTLILKSQYDALTNQQKNFTIHGVSPTETSTLYVSRESDIYDLSQEKIITVIYQYDYDETDGSGNVTPISERHVVNIHLNFRSGVPTVEDIEQPEIILPGDYVGLREPNVTPGAYEVTGGGWELFESQRDAESHTNGIDYDPNFDPLYWYQDGHYVAYYAKSYLGRTYSNAVPVAVANYHDLKKVMDATTHHYYIDNKNVKREPKIYINDYSGSNENGLDLFKNLYDLSLLNSSTVNTDEEGLITTIKETSTDSPFKGHALLDSRVQGGSKLEFFLRTDIERETETVANPAHETDPEAPETITRYKTWTPIASGENDPCFNGTFHGDGHTLSGLDHSVFGKLCGDVYNLGVTGSFTSAGVADQGDGYVESCWVKSTATALPGGASKTNPVFGDPSRGSGYQLVNSYFWEGNSALYNTVPANGSITYTNSSKGTAYAMTAQEFYNGTVAYDLNNFYLYKRYRDKNRTSSKATSYYYLPVQTDGTLPETPSTGYYPAAEDAQLCDHGYVESRFTDGDFRYAAGEIPTSEDERYWQETVSGSGETAVKEDRWSPIYPDDYIFFGQKLTYGWAALAHQEVPTAVVRDGGRLSQNTDANRVYRAPAYYRSKKMGVAHFNPHAYLAQKEKLTAEQIAANATPRTAYPGMTAIDFAGHNDLTYQLALVSDGLPIGGNTFYPPLLDDDGLLGITNCDETRNLLAYAPAATATTGYANQKTFNVLTGYFVDPDYNDYYDDTDHYRLVNKNDMPVVGHLVQSDLTATGDHFLVDKQDFNAPFQYTFDGSHRMWYQRLPENYVNRTKGWEGVSLPFTAELVTTHQKGEITHFYSGSTTSRNSTSKIGHEYWLRELENGSNLLQAKDKNNAVIANTYTAVFNYPSAAGSNKTVTNHFLWDYYYSQSDRKDKNTDIYQEYYHTDRTYPNYSFLTAAKPYIIGFPGRTYYEFDLSGEFSPLNTFAAIADLEQQTITFASNTNATINVSDDEMTGTEAKDGNTIYYFKPNYMNRTYEASSNTFIMNAEGSQFNEVTATATLDAFRPYFTTNADAQVKGQTRSIIFSINDEDIQPQMPDGQLHIRGSRHAILVTSAMTEPATVNIVNAAGVTVNTFTIQPGQTIKTNVIAGVYIVNQKKIAVD
ncbi:MAG: hypothetical protein IJU11_06140, partial [Prevotella sp.]|nr:hypothetical protein [Prevotella sp.]